MKLYHGTNKEYFEDIKKEGLKSPCLTDNFELALYYAEAAGGRDSSVVLEVEVETCDLEVDWKSVSEPVGFGKIKSKDIEENVRNFKGEWDWKSSLEITGAVKAKNDIHPEKVVLLFSATEKQMLDFGAGIVPKKPNKRQNITR